MHTAHFCVLTAYVPRPKRFGLTSVFKTRRQLKATLLKDVLGTPQGAATDTSY